jgi:hypothetical protein
MANQLSVQDVIDVTVTIEPAPALFRNFGIGLLVGNSNVIDVQQRIQMFTTLDGIEQVFGTNAPETQAATLFFEQEPQPDQLWVGRWASSATNGLLHGGLLSAPQQLLSNFTPITNGAFNINIDGMPLVVAGMNFSTALNLNAIASFIQQQLQTVAANAAVNFDAVNQRFNVMSGTTGQTSSVGPATSPTAQGDIVFTDNPTATETLSLGGTTVTFVSASPTGSEVLLGPTLAATLNNLQTLLNNSTDANISQATYLLVNNTLFVLFKTPGVTGDAFTLATTVTGATVSGATLSGGTGTDVSSLLNLTTAAGSFSVVGVAQESYLSAIEALDAISNGWYAAIPASNPMPDDADLVAASQFLEGDTTSRTHWVSTKESEVLNPDSSTDIAASLQTLGLNRTTVWYSSTSEFVAASAWGLGATINFEGQNTTISWMWKQLPGVAAESLSETQAGSLKQKAANVFVNYNNGKAITQFGTMAGGFFIDEIVNGDWLQNFVQTNVFDLFFDTPTKIPQTDPGAHQVLTAVNNSMVTAVTNGMLGANLTWTGPAIGSISTGDTLPAGFYCYVAPIATQASASRATRTLPPIQVAGCLAGAVDTVAILINVVR